MSRAISSLAVAVVCAGVLSGMAGCIAVGGNEHFTKPTLGRQLMDLKTARDTGAISESEYDQAKSDLLHGRASSAQVE